MRKLMETSQVLYWFGVASTSWVNLGMFSIFPPFYYGGFNAVISYITLLVVILMHVFCLTDKKVCDRSLFAISYFIYHLIIVVWIVVGLILAYIWSNQAYEDNWLFFYYTIYYNTLIFWAEPVQTVMLLFIISISQSSSLDRISKICDRLGIGFHLSWIPSAMN